LEGGKEGRRSEKREKKVHFGEFPMFVARERVREAVRFKIMNRVWVEALKKRERGPKRVESQEAAPETL